MYLDDVVEEQLKPKLKKFSRYFSKYGLNYANSTLDYVLVAYRGLKDAVRRRDYSVLADLFEEEVPLVLNRCGNFQLIDAKVEEELKAYLIKNDRWAAYVMLLKYLTES